MIRSSKFILLTGIILLSSVGTVGAFTFSDYGINVGKIEFLDLDGCRFVFIDFNGKHFELIHYYGPNKDPVLILYKQINNGASICMVGPVVEPIFILS